MLFTKLKSLTWILSVNNVKRLCFFQASTFFHWAWTFLESKDVALPVLDFTRIVERYFRTNYLNQSETKQQIETGEFNSTPWPICQETNWSLLFLDANPGTPLYSSLLFSLVFLYRLIKNKKNRWRWIISPVIRIVFSNQSRKKKNRGDRRGYSLRELGQSNFSRKVNYSLHWSLNIYPFWAWY